MEETVIRAEGLTKYYRMGEVEVQALRGVSILINRGEAVAIMGPSGSGKTTLMNILGCLDRPTGGDYILDGEKVSGLTDDKLAGIRNRKIGFVFQSFNLLQRTSALANVELPMSYSSSANDGRNRAVAALRAVGLESRMKHRPTELSGGEQQRVAIARALVNEPAILMADEPTGNLDSKVGQEIMDLLLTLNRERNTTLVIITHDQRIAGQTQRTIQDPRWIGRGGCPMKITRVIRETFTSLNANKLRTGLTVLGIVIGVAAVIAMLSVGQGAQNSITSQINSIGTNVLLVSAGSRARFAAGGVNVIRNIRSLTLADAQAIANPVQAPSVNSVAPIIQGGNISAAANGQTTTTTVIGVTTSYFSIRNEQVTEGSFFNDQQVNTHARVAIIGVDLATTLFGTTTNLTGQTMHINSQTFTIIGVLKSKGGSLAGSSDNQVIIPLTTARDRVISRPGTSVDEIYVQATSATAVTQANTQISDIMRLRHHVAVGKEDFSVQSQASLLTTATSITGILTTFLGGIAGISLLVGGIGIMNIMLVSVVERTREIGLRKALGARNRDIMNQFLAESSFLSLLGGLIGILLGWLISLIIGQIASAAGTALNPAVSVNAILLATLFSIAVGLFFGIYPARRAARLEPVEALRYE